MTNLLDGGPRIGGEATDIVGTLRRFGRGRSVPVGLVARCVGRDSAEVEEFLRVLNSKNIVRIVDHGTATGASVSLIR